MKEILKLTIYQFIYYLVKCLPAKARPKHLLLVKTDEIGDYILARNLLYHFKKSNPYKDHTITFVGNQLFKPLFDAYDTALADHVLWIDKKKFRTNLFYRFGVLKKIRQSGISDAINLIYTRNFRVEDVIIAVTTASRKITMNTKGLYLSGFERFLTPAHIYNHILDEGEATIFDAYRNTKFVEKILHITIPTVSTQVPVTGDTGAFGLPASYFVVFPGSGMKIRKWPAAYFSTVAKHIAATYKLVPVVCGSAGDKADCEQFILEFNNPVIDLTGKTTLPQFLSILKNASCLISIDTGAVHLAAAVQCPVYGLFSGLNYGRFAPYPAAIAPAFRAIYPDTIEEMIRSKIVFDTHSIPIELVKTITPQKVIRIIDETLPLLYTQQNTRGIL